MYNPNEDSWSDTEYPNFPEMHRHAVGTATLLDDELLYVVGPEKLHYSNVITKSPWISVEIFQGIQKRRTGGVIFLENIYGSPSILSFGGSVDYGINSKEVELISFKNGSFEDIQVNKLKEMDFELYKAQAAQLGDEIIVIKTFKHIIFYIFIKTLLMRARQYFL